MNAQGMAQPDVVWKKKKAIARTTVVRVLFFVRVLMLEGDRGKLTLSAF